MPHFATKKSSPNALISSAIGMLLLTQTSLLHAVEESKDVTTVVVKGSNERSYNLDNASTATKTDTPLKLTPITVQVVDAQLIHDKGLRSPNDVADLVGGVQPVVGYGNTPSQYFLIRGFSNAGVNFRNGYRVSEVYTPHDLANVERIEFVKGPASVLYGASQPGGAVNTITKTAQSKDFANLELSAGSYSTFRATTDINRSFGDLAFRLNVAADKGDSHINLESGKNWLIAPTATWKIARDTSLSYEGEFQKVTRDGFSNGLLNLPEIVNVGFGTSIAEPWNRLNNRNTSHRVEFKTALNQDWLLRQGVYDAKGKRSINTASPSFSSDPIGGGQSITAFGRVAYSQFKDNPHNTVSQTELIGKFNLGAITNTVVAGYEYARAEFDFLGAYNDLDTVNLYTFRAGLVPPVNNEANFGSRRVARSNAFYLQNQISLGQFHLLAGVRHERVKSSATDPLANTTDSQNESATTARVGALYAFTPETSAYYSFSQAFTPNTSARAADGSIFKAERGRQHEVGAKHTLLPGVESTLALFDITKENVIVPDPNNPESSIANGEQNSRGWEASIAGRVSKNLNLIANFTQLNAKVTRDISQQGATLYGVPRIAANLWALADFNLNVPGKFSFGFGVVRVGKREAAQPNLSYFKLPAYTRLDAGLFYRVGNVDVAFNLRNFNKAKQIDSLESSALFISAPRNWTLTLGLAL
ncbi:MAG: TonB-dependent siderophore receptor [Burkholderiaceae bacterium]|nr:TonB-dependent siderophore receptor [Burkholderiaceae bacterium]